MFAIKGHRLPACTNYEAALRVWEHAVVLDQDDPEGWRGLVNKRETDKAVRKVGGAIQFKLYSTVLVEWKSPTLLALTAHSTGSSGVFIDRFAPHGITPRCSRRDMGFQVGGWDGKTYWPSERSLDFALVDGLWQPDLTQCRTHETYVLDRKKAAVVRRQLKPWIDWRDSVQRLRGDRPRGSLGRHYIMNGELSALRALLEGRPVDFSEAYKTPLMRSPDLMTHALVLAGAVTKQPAPLGEPPKRSKYRHLEVWKFV